MNRLGLFLVFSMLCLSCPSTSAANPVAQSGSGVSEVWAREDAYWRYVKAGDVEGYLSLWHERFAGWQCTTPHPSTKSSIGEWVQDIRDRKIVLEYSITREKAEDFGNVVIVYYRTPIVRRSPSGETQWAGREFKLTHTWLRVGNTWQIIGGMCGDLTPPASK